jgi:Cu+-exporting ATPase
LWGRSRGEHHERIRQIVILVSNMSCVVWVERALLQVSGVTRADVNLVSDTATVTFVKGAVSAHGILTASTQADYAAKLNSQHASSEAQQRKKLAAKAYVRRTGFAGLLAARVILLGMGGHVVPEFDGLIMATIGHQSSWVIQFLFT